VELAAATDRAALLMIPKAGSRQKLLAVWNNCKGTGFRDSAETAPDQANVGETVDNKSVSLSRDH
jgi:hypothetical protein